MKQRFAALTLLITVFMLAITAQEAGKYREKYGPPDAQGRYIVRPGIGMTIKFAKNGKPAEMVIKRLDADESDRKPARVMSSAVAQEIIQEVAPIGSRGPLKSKGGLGSGCTTVHVSEYEQVSISDVTRCEAQGEGTYSASVRWK
jgi:hypothetical protein